MSTPTVEGLLCPTVWRSFQQTTDTCSHVEKVVEGSLHVAVLAELRLRFLRMSLTRHIILIRVGRFAKCGGEKVIKEFEALLASDCTDEGVLDSFIELAHLLLD